MAKARSNSNPRSRSAARKSDSNPLIKSDALGQIEAINRSQAVVEFEIDGTIIRANDLFLDASGYSLDEIQGKHHSMFVTEETRIGNQYREFWEKLRSGDHLSGEFKRIGKNGREFWIQGSYNPIQDPDGNVLKIVKYATDITKQKLINSEHESKINAIYRSQAVIEFGMDGTILDANDIFLQVMGYRLEEIIGKHHRIFVDEGYQNSIEYSDFWDTLNRGDFLQAEYQRVGKNGKEVWIQGTYNPLFDLNGKPYRVIKFATDVTERVALEKAAKEKTEKTQQLIEEVIESANQFAEGAQVVAESSSVLSDGAQNQAASVEQMNASVEELTEAIQVIYANANDSKDQALKTASLAKEAGGTRQEAVDAMQRIQKSSEKITDIIQVISDIASQTNLLALNAAIEAARAGEHGLGFAVVADEVRKLAERSSEAAKEITQLIKESTRRVEQGAELSEKVGGSLAKIVDAVDTTAVAIAKIAESTETQAASAEQVKSAIGNVSDTTESNAASAEELAASAEQLGAQASNLQELVTRFEV